MILSCILLMLADPIPERNTIKTRELTPLVEPTSSFGGAVLDGWLYIYSGHVGGEHEHSADNLSGRFQRLSLTDPAGTWQELPPGMSLQGVPLVGGDGKLYRIGGLSARNKKGEDEDLHSVATASVFDVARGTWSELPELPAARSSHDAVIVGHKLYVVGGWTLAGEKKTWVDSALVLDLKQPTTGWRETAKPPFQRRALAVAESQGKIYAIGGMDHQNKTSDAVDVYDPQSDSWSAGPAIPTESRMKAFGISAWGHGDQLFAMGTDGVLWKLDPVSNGWQSKGKIDEGRFFHRLLPAGPSELLNVGGASIKTGKHLASVTVATVP
jgi:hypothetical protein